MRRATGRAATALLLAALGSAGCASAARNFVRPFALAPSGLEVPEQRLRDALGAGQWDAALRQAGREQDGGPSDRLLRELYRGTAAYYAGRWDESGLAFQRAATMADDRYTKRVSRGALALATNDRALPYVPGDNERLFAHYYAALGYLHAGDLNGAAVEARRLGYRLQQADARRDPMDATARAALRYLTGVVFEATGDREDAEVAYRNAAALGATVDTAVARRAEADSAMRGTLRGSRTAPGAAASTAGRGRAPVAPTPTGEVVVFVESGFVAFRVNERMDVLLDDDARGALAASRRDPAWDDRPGGLGARVAALLSGDQGLWATGSAPALTLGADSVAAADTVAVPARGVAGVAPPVSTAVGRDPAPREARAGGQRGVLWPGALPVGRPRPRAWRTFTIAWPAYRRPAAWWSGLGVWAAAAPGGTPNALTTGTAVPAAAAPAAPAGVALPAVVRGDLSLAAAGDFRRDRAKVLSRLLTRAVLRATLTQEASRRDRSLGHAVRLVTNAVEQADTRSWHLLPGEVRVLRLRLPAGEQPLAVEAGGRRIPLGTVRVAPGGVRVVSARLWDAWGGRVTAFGVEGGPAAGAPPAARQTAGGTI